MSRRRRLAAAALTVVAVALAGCGAGGHAVTVHPVRSAGAPRPAGVKPYHPPASAAPAPPCDPRASGPRPQGQLPPPGQMPAGSAMDRIVQRGRLIAGVDQNSYYFGFRNPSSGQIEGFDIDVLHEIARAILGDPNAIQYKVVTSAERIPALTSGQVDIVADSMTITCDRLQQVAFSTDYFDAGQRVLVRKGSGYTGLKSLAGRKVCAAGGTTSIRTLAESADHPVPVAVDNWTDCLIMLEQNQVEAISTDDSILIGLAAQDPYTEMVGPRFTDEPHGLAIARTSPELVRFVNGVLERMRADGTWNRLYDHWLTPLGPNPGPPRAGYAD
ncbi:MAG: glutamate ABC transporter substrate-binding protein [Mycobacteriales bacterium]